MSKKTVILTASIVIIIAGVLIFKPQVSGFVTAGHDYSLDSFTECLAESNAVMYGAYWCPHCEDQKEWFGEAFDYINYVECDPRGKGGTPRLCEAKGIRGYPTWEIGGRFYEGAFPLRSLAELSGYSP